MRCIVILFFPGHEFTSCMNLDKKFHEIIALYSSPGKTFNVAGLQPANIIIPNEELRKKNINGLIHRQLTVREA